MTLRIQSIHFDATEQLQAYIQKKCDKLDQFFDRITEGEVFLKVSKPAAKQNKIVEIKLFVPGDTLVATDQADTFEAATDQTVAKLKSQLIKYKEKMRA
jgi:putative sigma-54 modulation protein